MDEAKLKAIKEKRGFMMSKRIEENIALLEQGITLQQFEEMRDRLMIDGSMDEYNEYGMYVVYNKTQNVYLVDGGNSPSAFSMSTSIPQFFLSYNGYGNPYMHQHYADGDEMILKFYRFDPQQFSDMGELEEAITRRYDESCENYFDYVLRMNGSPIRKGERPTGYNKYYNGAKKKPVVNNSLAAKLLRLEHNHKNLYGFLNALFDILIKPIPIFIYMIMTDRNLFYGENVIQKAIIGFFGVIGAYLASIMFYFIILGIIQIVKLFFCTYKPLVIHVRIFDILIKLGEKKLFTSEDYDLLEEHKYNNAVRKNKVSDGRQRAYENKQARQEEELRYRKAEFERNKEKAEYYRDSAQAGYESARKGDGFFTTAEEKRKQASRDLDTANMYAQDAARDEQRIAELERKLGK